MNCIFCKIIAGEAPSQKIFERDNVIAIMDINPMSPGHTLVLPKIHAETFKDISPNLYGEIMAAIQKISEAVVYATKAEGFNLIQNNGKCSGQVVPHVHFHIIPRKTMDKVSFNWTPSKYAKGEMEKLAEAIRSKATGGK